MTLQEFSTSSPGATAIKFFVEDRTIIAMNVASTACNGINTFDSLAGIITLAVPIEGIVYTFTILTRELKSDYYFFTVNPVYVPSLAGEVSDYDNFDCNRTTFLPSANDATFETSVYNAIIGNAIESRLSSFFFDVNRIKSQIKPTNYERIISGTANYAPVPDSNYSSVGFTRGRYIGTKTTSNDFGVDPALIASNFEGAIYTVNKDDTEICSELLSDKTIESFLFSPNLRYKPSNFLNPSSRKTVDALETPDLRKGLIQKGNSDFNFNDLSSTLTLNGNPDLKKGDHLLIVLSSLDNEGISGNYEYIHVTAFLYDSGTNSTLVSIEHRVFEKYGDISHVTITSGDSYSVYNLFGDSIYKPNGGQIYRIADKKVYIPETGKIFITDERGQIVFLSSTCST
jgi:hypothetical protein